MESGRKRCSKGRRRVAMEQIRNRDALSVCFCKRRKGIFKKASQLAILCGAQVAVVTHSPGGKPYSFGHPSAGEVMERYLDVSLHQAPIPFDAPPSCLERKLGEPPDGQFWWVDSIHLLDLDYLEMIERSMETIQRAILKKVDVLASAREAPAAGLLPLAMVGGSDCVPAPSVPSWSGTVKEVFVMEAPQFCSSPDMYPGPYNGYR